MVTRLLMEDFPTLLNQLVLKRKQCIADFLLPCIEINYTSMIELIKASIVKLHLCSMMLQNLLLQITVFCYRFIYLLWRNLNCLIPVCSFCFINRNTLGYHPIVKNNTSFYNALDII